MFRTFRTFRKPSKVFLVPFFTTMEVVVPLKNYPILTGISIRSFRHLELNGRSSGYEFIRVWSELQKSGWTDRGGGGRSNNDHHQGGQDDQECPPNMRMFYIHQEDQECHPSTMMFLMTLFARITHVSYIFGNLRTIPNKWWWLQVLRSPNGGSGRSGMSSKYKDVLNDFICYKYPYIFGNFKSVDPILLILLGAGWALRKVWESDRLTHRHTG